MTDPIESRDLAASLNALPANWAHANGLRFLTATRTEVTAELTVGPQHRQPYGLVHGGVYAGIVETLASIGAAADVMPKGMSAVGLDNHTSFLAACREGTLHGRATPVTRGSRTQVWDVTVTDDTGRLLATGRVRLLVLPRESTVAGGTLALTGG